MRNVGLGYGACEVIVAARMQIWFLYFTSVRSMAWHNHMASAH